MRNRKTVITGLAITGLAGAGVLAAVGVPAVMAGIRAAPGPVVVPKDWPAGKAAALRAEDQLREAAAGRPVVAPGSPEFGGLWRQAAGRSSSAARDAQAGFTQGVIPLTHGGPFRAAQFLGTNLWNGPVGGRWEVVQAGGVPAGRGAAPSAASPTRAAVFVYTRSANPEDSAPPHVLGALIPSGGPAGEFTITKVTGHVLTLSLSGSGGSGGSGGAQGKLYRFDTVTQRFQG